MLKKSEFSGMSGLGQKGRSALLCAPTPVALLKALVRDFEGCFITACNRLGNGAYIG